MRVLPDQELLEVWERGASLSTTQRVLLLLACACEVSPEQVAVLRIGQRDARLLSLREKTFGRRLASLACCPECHGLLEVTFDTTDIQERSEAKPDKMFALSISGYQIEFRLPNSRDVEAIADQVDIATAERVLLHRCLRRVCYRGKSKSADELPSQVVDAIAEEMSCSDPEADIRLSVSCPHCGHSWQAILDIGSFFWSEIQAWAHRTLSEVHSLASRYGWAEKDILAMSAWRRQFYLSL